MTTKELQRTIKTQRNIFLKNLINEFQNSDEKQNLFNCYDYVKTAANLNKEDFYKTISEEMENIIKRKEDIWFIPIESYESFSIFLDSNSIVFK